MINVMNSSLFRFVTWQNQFQRAVGHFVAWGTLTLVLITALVVILRYGFETGSIALQESIIYNHAFVFMLGIAYTYNQDKHVRVDVFYTQFSERKKAWVNLLGNLFFALPTVFFIAWVGWDYVAASWRIHEASSEAGGLGYVYLLKTLILVMDGLLFLQVLSHIAHHFLHLTEPELAKQLDQPPATQEEVDDKEATV
jgi:TRAP-type mannitol/chloroaromatic compound transport system permease small subunit